MNRPLNARDGATPAPAPLAMPTQSLTNAPERVRLRQQPRVQAARLVAFGGALGLTLFGAWQMRLVFGNETFTPAQTALLVLFTVTFGWIAFSAAQAAAALFAHRAPDLPARSVRTETRVALIMPVYNEEPGTVCAALQAMGEGLAEAGAGKRFEIFVLSDTRDPDVWVRETACFAALRRALRGRMKVWYRRRADNAGRKAGNLREFVETWGGRYDHMLVLDADSIMDPGTMIAMADRMVRAPRLGILQTVPVLAGGRSVFARVQQFAGRVYGPVIARGVAAWQGTDGNYWGHNAIIRVRAFAACCGMPELPGRMPFGGHVLSHDFVEAALIRRGGWEVRMDTDLGGSWEGAPQSLLDLAARDRRWAQGNLQHSKVLAKRGFAWPNRAHFVIGIGSYAMSPVWLALLAVGTYLTAQSLIYDRDYFGDEPQLFPDWPVFDSERMLWLLCLSMLLLFLPKIVGAARSALVPGLRRAHGGAGPVIGGAVVEIVLSALLAPILMLFQTRQVIEILAGRDSGWASQSREAQTMPWSQAIARHWAQALAGLVGFAVVIVFAPAQVIWLAPVLAGLLLAPLLSRGTSAASAGPVLGLLDIPEDRTVPAVMRRHGELGASYAAAAELSPAALLSDAGLAATHLAALGVADPVVQKAGRLDHITARAKLAEAASADEALAWLTRAEMSALLGSRELLSAAVQRFGAHAPPAAQ